MLQPMGVYSDRLQIRPALYQAHHEIIPLKLNPSAEFLEYEVVGPICESGDFLAHARRLPTLSSGTACSCAVVVRLVS
jgi:diaminopimelate decarboxylase